MKHVQQNSKRRAGILGMICLLAVSLSSCLKGNNNDTPLPPAALLSVVNASPDSGPVDFYLEPNRANNSPIIYGFGIDYIRASVGKRTATFTNAGGSTKLKSDTLTLQQDQVYSLFLSNLIATPEYLLLRDTIAKPASGSASFRFINLSPDAGAVDLAIKTGATLVANKNYKGRSSFAPVPVTSGVTLEVRQAGTSTVLATLENVPLREGYVYTMWLQGLKAATDAKKPTIRIQINAFY